MTSGLGFCSLTGYREGCTAHPTDVENPQNTDRIDRTFEYVHFLIGQFIDSDKHLPTRLALRSLAIMQISDGRRHDVEARLVSNDRRINT